MAGDDTVTVTETGPLFDGTMEGLIATAAHEIEQELGEIGYQAVQDALDGDLQNPTGFYQSQIEVTDRGDGTVVTGDSVIYHWWLAGASSRNSPVTSFEGYDHWTVANQAVTDAIPEVAGNVIADILGLERA